MSSQKGNDQANKLTKESNQQEKDPKTEDTQKEVLPGSSAALPFRPQASSSGTLQSRSGQSTGPTSSTNATAPISTPPAASGSTATPTRSVVPPHARGGRSDGPAAARHVVAGSASGSTVSSGSATSGTPAAQSSPSGAPSAYLPSSQAAVTSPGAPSPLTSAAGKEYRPPHLKKENDDATFNTTAAATSTLASASSLPASGPGSSSVSGSAPQTATHSTAVTHHSRPNENDGHGATPQIPVSLTGSTTATQQGSSIVQISSSASSTHIATRPTSFTLAEGTSIVAQSPTAGTQPSASNAAGSSTTTKSNKKQSKPRSTFFDAKYATAMATTAQPKNDVSLRVNHFKIAGKLLGPKLYVYTVVFPKISGRDVTNAAVKKTMMSAVLSAQQPWAAALAANELSSDYVNTIVTKKPFDELTGTSITADLNGDFNTTIDFHNQASSATAMDRNLPVVIKLSKTLDMSELGAYIQGQTEPDFNFGEFMQALNILVRHFAIQHQPFVGRNRVFPTQNGLALPSKLLPRIGYFNSARPFTGSLQLQLNASAAAFYPTGTLLNFLKSFILNFDPEDDDGIRRKWPEIWGAIKGLKVRLLYTPPDPKSAGAAPGPLIPASQGRLKTIYGYGDAATTQKFQNRNTGTYPTVKHYFETHVINFQLVHYRLPVINLGDKERTIWFPMELLAIEVHQAFSSTLPQRDMDTMAKLACKEPEMNVKRIMRDGLGILRRHELETNNVITISDAMSEVKGRFLPIPQIQYKAAVSKNDLAMMAMGKWDIKGKKFHAESTLGKLLIIQVGGGDPVPKATRDSLLQSIDKYGAKAKLHDIQPAATASIKDLNGAYDRLKKDDNANIVLVILPAHDAEIYAQVKQWGELHADVHTICVTQQKIIKLAQAGFQANIALKFNARLGGRNHIQAGGFYKMLHNKVDDKSQQTMILGADVTHPGPASLRFCPSIAAVVASTDEHCVTYPGSMRLQASKQEQIADLRQMVQERLQVWHDHNKSLPSRLLFYRDGVSEDQFSMVASKEYPEIEQACQDIKHAVNWEGEYQPAITLVVCTKRHQTRFYQPANISDEQKKNFLDKGNAKPGPLVDDPAVRLPKYFDFYLQAHNALQGTAKPCHYFVIKNGIGFKAGELQALTNGLSWIYATALTPISLAAPAYYADKLCERGRCYIRPLLMGSHPLRPKIEDVMQGISDDVDEDAKKAHVVQYLTNTEFWPGNNEKNPCLKGVKETMFYI